MKALLVGFKPVKFTPRGENEEKSGLSLYYTADSPEAIGLYAGDIWVDEKKSPKMFNFLVEQDYLQPVPVDMVFEMIPGRKNPLLIEIRADESAG